MKVEICVDSVEGAIAAERGGAARVELCDNLMEGGTTPSAGCIKIARAALRIGLNVIIRPRGGDFLYSSIEHEVMKEDIAVAKSLGADGVVIGCLTPTGQIDIPRTEELIRAARPMSVTFHRAFDLCVDPYRALEEVIAMGADRLLTSGQEGSSIEGMDLIAELERLAAGRIIIMPGGGLTPLNVTKLVKHTGVREVHLSARSNVESGMIHRNGRVFMGGTLRPPEYSRKTTDERSVRAVVNATKATV